MRVAAFDNTVSTWSDKSLGLEDWSPTMIGVPRVRCPWGEVPEHDFFIPLSLRTTLFTQKHL